MEKRNNKQINKERLLTEGVNMLMAQGYHGTGLKEILDAVNIPKGSFYNYFPSKEDYAAAAIQHYIEPFIQRLSAYLQQPGLDALPALQLYLNELIVDLEKAEFKGGCLLGNMMGEVGDTSETCKDSLQSAVKRYRDLYIQALSTAQEQGHIRKDKSAEAMADLLINGFQGALLRMKIERTTAPLTDCCQALLGDYFRV